MSKSRLGRSGHIRFPIFQVRTCPNQDSSDPDMSKSGLFRSGHVQITTFQVRTWRNADFWSNLVRFRSKNKFLTKWHNDSASFLPEKLKNQVILIKNLNIWPKTWKWPKNPKNNPENPRKIWFSYGFPMVFLWFSYVVGPLPVSYTHLTLPTKA